MNIKISSSFKSKARSAIIAILLFIISYIILFLVTITLVILSIIGAIQLLAMKLNFFTLLIGAGIILLSVFVFYFVIKFLFKKHTPYNNNQIEVTRTEEPILFKMIDEIVEEVGTHFPKKVFISPDVNASVSYDSTFWSMFYPIKKNLTIGLGLVNGSTKQELKAVLAHEFGHFSQKSMKVGSYVYNVNQIIFNLVEEDPTYENNLREWGNYHSFLSFFAELTLTLVRGIQWILRKMYSIVNIRYMALSREMEFHADEVAANVAGSKPLDDSLLRIDLIDTAFSQAINYFNEVIVENKTTNNIYLHHNRLIQYLATENKLEFKNSLPIVHDSDFDANKSKLNIKDQWASHPTNEERTNRLRKLAIVKEDDNDLANFIFEDIVALQEKITVLMFDSVSYEEEPKLLSQEEFLNGYIENLDKNNFPKIFENYYDYKFSMKVDLSKRLSFPVDFKDLFGKTQSDEMYTLLALKTDLQTLENIINKEFKVNTFDYDGQKYRSKDASKIHSIVKKEYDDLQSKIEKNDQHIFEYFYNLAEKQNLEKVYHLKYQDFLNFDKVYDENIEYVNALIEKLAFLSKTTPIEIIQDNFKRLKVPLKDFKEKILILFEDEFLKNDASPELRAYYKNFKNKEHRYFSNEVYVDEDISDLTNSINDYPALLNRILFLRKKDLLDFQARLYADYSEQKVI